MQHKPDAFSRFRVKGLLAALRTDGRRDMFDQHIALIDMEDLFHFLSAELATAADFALGHIYFLLLTKSTHSAGSGSYSVTILAGVARIDATSNEIAKYALGIKLLIS